MSPQEALDKATRAIDDHFDACLNELVTNEPKDIFHYTSTRGLLGILEKRCFYASDVLSMRDQSEFRLGVAVAQPLIEELFAAKRHSISSSLRRAFAEFPLLGVGKTSFFHAVCFCDNRDALTQWQAFTATGGFALGLDFKETLLGSKSTGKFFLAKMLYNLDEQKALIMKVVTNGVTVFDEFKYAIEESAQHLNQFVLHLGVTLLNSICRFKHPCFQSEREWRILVVESYDQTGVNPKFRVSGQSVTPYCEIPLDPTWITRIVRSPGAWPENHLYSVQRFARSIDDKIKVEVSALPFT